MGEASVISLGFGDQKQSETSCCTCGVVFTIPKGMYDQRRSTGESFYCPNGHCLSFRTAIKNEVDRLREEVEAHKRVTKMARANATREREAREAAERRAAAARGQVTRIKNRVGNGVCPCCNRTFQNLQRHMHTKHPGYSAEGADGQGST